MAADLTRAIHEALALHQAGRLQEAERLYRRILSIDPEHPDCLNLLGVAAMQGGRYDLAIEMALRSLAIRPDFAEAHCNLGMALFSSGDVSGAVIAYQRALELSPDLAEAHNNLGNALQAKGAFADAAEQYERAIALKPGFAEAHNNLGNAQRAMGLKTDSAERYRRALAAKPEYAEAHNNLGNVLQSAGRIDEAIAHYEMAISFKPRYAEAHYNLGLAMQRKRALNAAISSYDTAIDLLPSYAEAFSNRGGALKDLGRSEEAVASYRRAIELRPTMVEAHSNLLVSLHYAATTQESILAEAKRFAAGFGLPAHCFGNNADPDKRLRIGYVSGDFRRHPVGYFLLGVFSSHDHSAFETFCYSNHTVADDMTHQLCAATDHWRDVAALSDEQAAALVVADGIDILVDLSGHTANNRLPLFARKPAPVQVSWLGYWGTTGLSAMDYLISDEIMIRPEEESHYTEKVIRLPAWRLCYTPPRDAPIRAIRRGQPLTFGSFNNLAKVGPATINLWAAVLREIPQAKLLIKWRTLAEPAVRQALVAQFSDAGISHERLELRDASPHGDMLREYADMDIALDPYPFSGATTSCEALWMGVPVVTLHGPLSVSRQTTALLHSIGLDEFATASPEDYVAVAADLASDRARLHQLRQTLRQRMGPICDSAKFTEHLERAYREIWRLWCGPL